MTSRKPQTPEPTSHPAPWTLKGEMYWLIAKAPIPLPASAYHPLEQQAISGSANDFQGGLCYIQIVRYSDSPVGPYDELAIVPGVFKVPGGSKKVKGKKKMRVTRIYVSQKETMFDGRNNWNIPKHLARFEFSSPLSRKGEAPPKELSIAVYPPDTAERSDVPFFRATLTPSTWLPAVPMSTKYLPLDVSLVQPPLLQGNDPYETGTDRWRVTPAMFAAKCRLMWVQTDHESTKTQDEHWPQQVKPWSLGIWMEEGTFQFAVPAEEFAI